MPIHPLTLDLALQGFGKRGGLTDYHEDGFGIVFLSGQHWVILGFVSFMMINPAIYRLADLVNHYPIEAMNVIAHIRKGNHGGHGLANIHPFVRKFGENNGHLPIMGRWAMALFVAPKGWWLMVMQEHYAPVGTTDSELAFCYLLNRLKQPSKHAQLMRCCLLLTAQCRYLAANGLFNCLISNGNWQLAYAGSLLFYFDTQSAPLVRRRCLMARWRWILVM